MDLAAINDYDILKITVGSSAGVEAGYVSPELAAHFDLGGAALSLADLQPRVSDRHLPQYLLGWARKVLGTKLDKGPFALERAVRAISRGHPKTLVSAVLRKRTAEAFRKPIQGRYGGENIESESLRGTYAVE
jgi:hypothetical protein